MLYGAAVASEAASTKAHLPAATRWGSLDATRDYLLNRDFRQQLHVMLTLLDSKKKACKTRRTRANSKAKAKAEPHVASDARSGAPVDEVALDQTKVFREQRSRWDRETRASIVHTCFWLLMRIAQVCSEPLALALNFLQSKRPRLRHFVSCKLEELSMAFQDIFTDAGLDEDRLFKVLMKKDCNSMHRMSQPSRKPMKSL